MKSIDRRLASLERKAPKPPADDTLIYLPLNGRDDQTPGRHGRIIYYTPEFAAEVRQILEDCGALGESEDA